MKEGNTDNRLPKKSSESISTEVPTDLHKHASKVSRGTKTEARKPKRKTKKERAGKRQTYRVFDRIADVRRLDTRVWKWAAPTAKKLLRALELSPERKCRGGERGVSATAVEQTALLNRVLKIIEDLKNIPVLDAQNTERPVAMSPELLPPHPSESSLKDQRPVTSPPAEIAADKAAIQIAQQDANEVAAAASDNPPESKPSLPDPKKSSGKAMKIDPNQTGFGF